MSTETIPCTFSLLSEGRTYTGNHRQYAIENARTICYSPVTRERIKNREAFGYYGHGRRVISGKMDLPEVDVITLQDGTKAMVSNIPSNVTTKFEIASDGTVTHEQEVLDTETGKIVSSLHKSKVGGFSWACPGKDGGRRRQTVLTGFSGFDYVLSPSFSANRGYVLESAHGDAILESVAAVIGDDKKAEQIVAGWRLESIDYQRDLEDAILESKARCDELEAARVGIEKKLKEVQASAQTLDAALKKEQHNFKAILEGIAEQLPFVIPDDAMHAMLEGDFSRARGIFESAKAIDYSQYPLDKKSTRPPQIFVGRKEPVFGTAEYGWGLKL